MQAMDKMYIHRFFVSADFYNWNRVKIRYCDSASFAGDTLDKGTGLYLRGQRIWEEAVQHLLSIGMASADQVLLTGCSAGGLAAILHCDQFGAFFAGRNTTVKCLADAGLFLDVYVYSCARSPHRIMHHHGLTSPS
jgi:hypothetical protein